MTSRFGTTPVNAVAGALVGVAVALLAGASPRGVGSDVGFGVGAVVGILVGRRWPTATLPLLLAGPALLAVRTIPAAPVVGIGLLVLLCAFFAIARRADHHDDSALPVPSWRASLVPAGAVGVGATVVYSTWSVTRHERYGSGSWDYGCYVHNAWLFGHGDAFAVDARSAVLGDVAFWGGTNHFMPTLVLTAPVAWLMQLTHDTSWLAVAQVVVVVCAAIPLVIAARARGIAPMVSTTLAAAFLFHVGTQAALFFDVHEIAFAPLLLLSALATVDAPPTTKRVVAVIVLGLLLAGTKEGSWLYLAALGALLVARRAGWRVVGAAFVVVGVVGFGVVVAIIQPALLEDGSAGMIHAARFTAVNDGVGGIGGALRSWLLHPGRALATLLSPTEKTTTIATSVLGFAALPLLSVETLILGLPNLVERFLADKREMWGLAYHYGLFTAAWLAWGALDVVSIVMRRRLASPHVIVSALIVATVASFVGSPRQPDLAHLEQPYFASGVDVDRYDRALAVVVDSDAVVAQNHFLPHLALRSDIWLPEDRFIERADVVILDTDASPWPARPQTIKAMVKRLHADTRFDVAFHEGTTWVFRRRQPPLAPFDRAAQ